MLDQPQHSLRRADPTVRVRLDGDAQPRAGGGGARPGKGANHVLVFGGPIPLGFGQRRPFLRGRALQKRSNRPPEWIRRAAGDQRRSKRSGGIDSAPKAIKIRHRRRRAFRVDEGQVEEEVGQRQAFAADEGLQRRNALAGVVVLQSGDVPGHQLDMLAAGVRDPLDGALVRRKPSERPRGRTK